jgi:DNA polymerase-3 subunit beta
MKFHIEIDTLKALTLAAAKGDVRYYLNAVCIDVRATDAVAVATNGHILLALPLATDSELVHGQYIIPRELVESLKAPFKNACAEVTIDTASQSVTVTLAGASTSAKLVEARFPEWRRVVPKTVSHQVSQFEPDYIALFKKIHKLLGGSNSPAIAHNGDGHEGGGSARVILPRDAIGVLMPMRHSNAPAFENPDWMLTAPAPVSQAA